MHISIDFACNQYVLMRAVRSSIQTFSAVLDKKYVNRKARWIAIVAVMYIAASIHNALTWEFVVNAFLDHGSSPLLLPALGDQPQWFRGLIASVFSFGILMTDCLSVGCLVFLISVTDILPSS